MTDLRTRLAEALGRWRCATAVVTDEEFADVLLSLPGIAIVEVPEGAYVSVRYSRDALIAKLNAEEAAAADAAEGAK